MKGLLYTFIFAAIASSIVPLSISCNRKAHVQTSTTEVDSSYKAKYDSSVQVNKTLSEAYESLLQANSSTDVLFECPDCPNGNIGGSGMPHVVSKITVDSKGNKTFEGAIKSYREAASVIERKYYTLTESYDSLSNAKAELEKNYSLLEKKKDKVVKQTVFPWYFWLIVVAGVIGGFVLRHKVRLQKIEMI